MDVSICFKMAAIWIGSYPDGTVRRRRADSDFRLRLPQLRSLLQRHLSALALGSLFCLSGGGIFSLPTRHSTSISMQSLVRVSAGTSYHGWNTVFSPAAKLLQSYFHDEDHKKLDTLRILDFRNCAPQHVHSGVAGVDFVKWLRHKLSHIQMEG